MGTGNPLYNFAWDFQNMDTRESFSNVVSTAIFTLREVDSGTKMGVAAAPKIFNLLLGRRKKNQTTMKEMMMHAWHDHTAALRSGRDTLHPRVFHNIYY